MGVKVTLRRIYGTEAPATRLFQADNWKFFNGDAGPTLVITSGEGMKKKIGAEFPVDVVESVEFV